MRTELYWIPGTWPGRLAITPRPRGGDWLEDEVRAWRDAGIDVVVSLLEQDEAADLGLANEAGISRTNRIDFVSFPIADHGIPGSVTAASALVADLAARLRDGKNVAVHCRQGIGRAALVAAALLIRLGMDAETAIGLVGTARGRPVPETAKQREWITNFARLTADPVPA